MAGIRPQAVDRAARILDDFTMDVDGCMIHLLDAPSPELRLRRDPSIG
jgi:hypothetical protein